MRNILHFAWYTAPYGGSFINQIVKLKNELAKNKYNLILVLPIIVSNEKWCVDLMDKNIIDIRFIKEKSKNEKRKTEIEQIIDAENPILIHSHFGMIENELIKICKRKKIAFVYHSRAELPKANNFCQKIKYYIKYAIFYKGVYIVRIK